MVRQWCSLSMPCSTCEKLHGGVGLGGIEHAQYLAHVFFYFKSRGIKENPIPYMV